MNRSYDVVILGSGFAGSLLGLILTKLGQSVLIIDRQKHPRFAIGESSTPAADFILESLCHRYDLQEVRPICRYGSWVRTYPEIDRGLKRGFSYFHHSQGERFRPGLDHARELLVAASIDDEVGDTHWFRSDVDAFLAKQFVAAGGTLWEDTTPSVEAVEGQWTIHAVQGAKVGTHAAVQGRFLIDATGGDSALVRFLQLRSRAEELLTRTRSLFGHFRQVREWSEILDDDKISQSDHPFPCDHAALHHVIPGGWMWVLRFDQGITSVGWSLDTDAYPVRDEWDARGEWNRLLDGYPSIADQLRDAIPVSPFSASEPLRRTGRLQRLVTPAAGENWALLPHTAGFIDPFFSTGIALSLLGVEQLAGILGGRRDGRARAEQLEQYSQTLGQEIRLIDQLVSLAIKTMRGNPQLLHAASMVYFAAATTFEQRRLAAESSAFLLADDEEFIRTVREISSTFPGRGAAVRETDVWVRDVEMQIARWNSVGLFHPLLPGMYSRTSTKDHPG